MTVSVIIWDMDLSMPMEMESAIIGAKIVPRVMVAETVKETVKAMETAAAMARVINTAETDKIRKPRPMGKSQAGVMLL